MRSYNINQVDDSLKFSELWRLQTPINYSTKKEDIMNYEGKTVLVTGGAKGIGKGVCNVFTSYGANIVVADFDLDGAEIVAKEINEKGGRAFAVKIDVANKSSVEEAVSSAVKQFGSVEMLVNAAGIVVSEKLENLTEEDWDRIMDVDLKGTFLVGQAVSKEMKKHNYGKIVFIASAASKDAEYANGVYCAAKAGVDMLTHVFAMELAEYNINVNSVNPSYVDTDLMESCFQERGPLEGMTPDEYRKQLLSTVPLNRMASTTEIGELCAMLCSDKIGFLDGENVLIAGAKVMRL